MGHGYSYWHSSRYHPRSAKNSKGPILDAAGGGWGGGSGLGPGPRARAKGQGPGPRARVACAQTRTRMNVHKHLQTSHTFILVHKHACTRMNVHKHFQTFLIQTHTCLGHGPRARAKGQGAKGPRAKGPRGQGPKGKTVAFTQAYLYAVFLRH